MHIPSREELHLKTKEQNSTTVLVAQTLYCEGGTTLDQATDFAVKYSPFSTG